MKPSLKLISLVLLAFSMLACGERKLTDADMKRAEATLYNDDMSTNEEAVPAVMEKYCEFVEQNPDAATAPEWLFKAMQLAVGQQDVEKSEALCDKLIKDYPESDKTPAAMFMMALYVYQLSDIDKARSMYERVVANYPDSQWAADAKVMIDNYLGMTDEQILSVIEQGQGEVVEEEVLE